MKRIIPLLLSLCLLASCSSTGPKDPAAASPSPEANNTIQAEKNIFSVEITLPASMVGEDITQETLDADLAENGFTSATLNADGSVTYKMPKDVHENLMTEMAAEIDTALAEMVDPETFIKNVTANDDYTVFTVELDADELGMLEAFSALGCYIQGGMYNAFNGTPADDIVVRYVNVHTGEVIHEAHSAQIGNTEE